VLVRLKMSPMRPAATLHKTSEPGRRGKEEDALCVVPRDSVVLFLEDISRKDSYTSATRIVYKDLVGWVFGDIEWEALKEEEFDESR